MTHEQLKKKSKKGEVENQLLSYAGEHKDTIEIYILRPAMVFTKETTLKSLLIGLGPSVRVDVLAGTAVETALTGSKHQILENSTINQGV